MRLSPRNRSASQIVQAKRPVFRLVIALVALQSPVRADAQQISVLDAKCRSEIVSACYKRLETYRVNPGIEPCGSGKISNPGGCSEQSYLVGSQIERCSAWFEVEQYGSCLRTIDLSAVASGTAIVKELSDTNRILRSDMRTLLNGMCKSYSPKPETCDASIPAQ